MNPAPPSGLGLRLRRGAALGAAVFGAAGLALHRAWLGDGPGILLQALAALVLMPLFALAGAAIGTGLAITGTLRRLLPEVERRLDALVGLVIARLADAARTGADAETAPGMIEAETRGLALPEPPDAPPGPGRAVAQLAWAWLLAIVRRRLTQEAIARVGRHGIQRLARQTIVGAVIGDIGWRLGLTHAALLIAAAIAVVGPVVWLVLQP